MNNFNDINVVVAVTSCVGLSIAMLIVSAPLCNSGECNL